MIAINVKANQFLFSVSIGSVVCVSKLRKTLKPQLMNGGVLKVTLFLFAQLEDANRLHKKFSPLCFSTGDKKTLRRGRF